MDVLYMFSECQILSGSTALTSTALTVLSLTLNSLTLAQGQQASPFVLVQFVLILLNMHTSIK